MIGHLIGLSNTFKMSYKTLHITDLLLEIERHNYIYIYVDTTSISPIGHKFPTKLDITMNDRSMNSSFNFLKNEL